MELSEIKIQVNMRFNEMKKIVITERRGDENMMLSAAFKEGPLHTVAIPAETFFTPYGTFDGAMWAEEARRTFEDVSPYIIGLAVPITLIKSDESQIGCIGVACIHRFWSKIGGYIEVGDEYMWEENFKVEMMLPFMATMRHQLAQYG